MRDTRYMERETLIGALKALSDLTRLSIFEALMDGVHCNCEIAERLGLSLSLISHHLHVLQQVDLISGQRADEVDDTDNIRNYAKNLVEAWNSATCEGSATIQGLTTFYRLGDAVEGVHEEEISFDLSASKVRAFPSVTGIRYLPQEQKTIIRFGLFGREDLI